MLFKSLHIFFEIVVFSTFEIFGSLKAYFYFFDMCIKSPSSFAKGTPKGEGEGGVAQYLRLIKLDTKIEALSAGEYLPSPYP